MTNENKSADNSSSQLISEQEDVGEEVPAPEGEGDEKPPEAMSADNEV